MTKKIHVVFASLVAIISALAFPAPATTEAHDGQHRSHTSTSHVHRRATKARKRVKHRTVSYVCPMHPDMRSQSRGECPKCRMELVRDQAFVLSR